MALLKENIIAILSLLLLLNTSLSKPQFHLFRIKTQKSDISQQLNIAPLNIEQFRRYVQIAKTPVIDFRLDVGKGIIPGSLWLTSNGKFQNYIPYFYQKTDRFLAVVQQGTQDSIILRLRSAGYYDVIGWNNFNMQTQWPYQVIKPTIMKGPQVLKIKNRIHLDIRTPEQWKSTGIIQGSILISFNQLMGRIKQLSGKTNIVVNCAGAYRARGGWSVLQKYGIDSTVLDQNFNDLKGQGFNIVPYSG